MSKDRQQRREQQASVTSGQAARDVTQAQGTAKDIPATELPHGFAAIDETTVAARAPAEIIEHAERLKGGVVEPEDERPEGEKPVDRVALIAGLPPAAPLVSCPTCVGQGKVPKPEADRMMNAPAKPPANIPKAVHHLRRAIMTVGTLDPTWRIMEEEFSRMVGRGNPVYESSRRTLESVAAVLEMDAHGGAQAAKDVRAAIEALS